MPEGNPPKACKSARPERVFNPEVMCSREQTMSRALAAQNIHPPLDIAVFSPALAGELSS